MRHGLQPEQKGDHQDLTAFWRWPRATLLIYVPWFRWPGSSPETQWAYFKGSEAFFEEELSTWFLLKTEEMMSQTHLGDVLKPSDHFFTFAELPAYYLALSWRCPWHTGRLNRAPWTSPSPVTCPCMITKDNQWLPPLLGPELTPQYKNYPSWAWVSLAPLWLWWPLHSRSYFWSCPDMDLSCCLLGQGAVTSEKL